MIHKNINVYGQVQGVGFRFATLHSAKSYGVKGFVKNQPDGSVYIEAEGDELRVNHFIQWCRQGPPYSRVTDISVSDGPIKNFNYFDVRY